MFKQVIDLTKERYDKIRRDINKCMKHRIEHFVRNMTEKQRADLLHVHEVNELGWPVISESCDGEYVSAINEIKRNINDPHKFLEEILEVGANAALDSGAGEKAKVILAPDMKTFSIKFTVE